MSNSLLSKLILGTVQFGLNYGINNRLGKPKEEEVDDILLTAFNNNIEVLDTAEAYGDAQKRIGDFHKRHPEIRFDIITKFYDKNFSGDFEKRIKGDIDELNIETLYAYMFHNITDFFKYQHGLDTLFKMKQKGVIKKIGVSVYTNDEVLDIIESGVEIDLVQLPFNLLDNNNKRLSVLKRLKEKNIEVHTRSVFLQGLFFMNDLPDSLKVFSRELEYLKEIAKKNNTNIKDMALNYCVANKYIDKVLIGVDTKNQLSDNINSLKGLNKKTIEEVDKIDFENTKYLNPANW